MDTFTAIPSITRLPITILDTEKYQEWLNSPDFDAPVPTKVQVFLCYRKDNGAIPVPVQIEIDRIDTEYTQERPELDAEVTPELIDKWRRVNMALRRNLLLAVVRGLGEDDANILATETMGEGHKLLIKLGWLPDRTNEDVEETENKEEGEGEIGE